MRTDLDDYFSWEDEEKLEYCNAVLAPLLPTFQGKLKRVDDDELHLQGQSGDRKFRLKIDFDTGWTTLELRLANKKGVLSLHRDKDQADGAPPEEPDEWDEQDRRETKEFLAPHIYIEEYKDEFEAMKQLLGTLPGNTVAEVAKFMNATQASHVLVDAESLNVRFDPEYYKVRLDQLLPYAVQFCGWLAAMFEAGDQEVSAKPRVYIGGQAVTGGALNLVRCGFCSGMVKLDPAGRCPNCGAVNKQ
jgi:uncharacterized protein (DUF1499 family)